MVRFSSFFSLFSRRRWLNPSALTPLSLVSSRPFPRIFGIFRGSAALQQRNFSDDADSVLKMRTKRRKFFDLKTFRQHLRRQKAEEILSEKREIAKTYAKPPPDGWSIATFLQKMGMEEDRVEEVAQSFESWESFISSTVEELSLNESLKKTHRKMLWKYINLYNCGLWPDSTYEDYVTKFQAQKLSNENKPWDANEDEKLKNLADYYDVNFGDPWIYISWQLQRNIEEVKERYIEVFIKPQYRASSCELTVTKANKPLLMARYFKLDVPFLYIVPSEDNFPLEDFSLALPPKYEKFRDPTLFRSGNT